MRANVDDRAARVIEHQRQGGAGNTKNAEHIGLHHGFPIFVFAFGDGVQAKRSAGVVDEHVEFAAWIRRFNFVAGPFHEFVHAGGLADIEGMKMRFGCAEANGIGLNFSKAIESPRAKKEARSFGSKGSRGGRAETAGSAGDEDPFILELHAAKYGRKSSKVQPPTSRPENSKFQTSSFKI